MSSINLNDYITASGKYPERLKSPELTDEVIKNMNTLLDKVNNLLKELKIQGVTVSSGFRPSAVNANVAGAAKKSSHLTGKAIDIVDDAGQSIANVIAKHPELLRKYGLFLENPAVTKGKTANWVHLDFADRKDRPSRIFNP